MSSKIKYPIMSHEIKYPMNSKIKCPIMSREIKYPMKSQDAQQNDKYTRPRDQNMIIVNIYHIPSVDTQISTSEDKEGQTGLRQEKKIAIWKWIERINLIVDSFKNMKEIWYFVYTHYFHVFLDLVKHCFRK